MKTEREMFEDWARKNTLRLVPSAYSYGEFRKYYDFAWEAWQARAKAVPVPPEPELMEDSL